MLYLTLLQLTYSLLQPFSIYCMNQPGSGLSCLSVATQEAEQVQRAERTSGNTQEKHQECRTALGCTVFPNCFTTYSGKKFLFVPGIYTSLGNETSPASNTGSLEGTHQLAKTHSPKVVHPSQQHPASKHLTEGQLLGEGLRGNHLCKYHLQSSFPVQSGVRAREQPQHSSRWLVKFPWQLQSNLSRSSLYKSRRRSQQFKGKQAGIWITAPPQSPFGPSLT